MRQYSPTLPQTRVTWGLGGEEQQLLPMPSPDWDHPCLRKARGARENEWLQAGITCTLLSKKILVSAPWACWDKRDCHVNAGNISHFTTFAPELGTITTICCSGRCPLFSPDATATQHSGRLVRSFAASQKWKRFMGKVGGDPLRLLPLIYPRDQQPTAREAFGSDLWRHGFSRRGLCLCWATAGCQGLWKRESYAHTGLGSTEG